MGQRKAREEDRRIRVGLLEYFWDMVKEGVRKAVAAALIRVPLRTLQKWANRESSPGRGVVPFGRQPKRGSAEERNAVVATLKKHGPTLGVPSLHDRHRHMSRCELSEIKRRWVRIQIRRHKRPIKVLHWTRPGTAWAMDYTEPDAPVEGTFRQILTAQDLASRDPLLARPLPGKSGERVAAALQESFRKCGAPLVLKMDNDSTFLDGGVSDVLERWNVLPLLSPPRTPWYNGAVELTNGVLKRLAAWSAMQGGRHGCWSCDDVQNARDTISSLRRAGGLTRRQAFEARASIPESDRTALRSAFERNQPAVREELLRRLEADPSELSPAQLAELEAKTKRVALERALVQTGLLFYRSRRVSPLLSAKNRARIT